MNENTVRRLIEFIDTVEALAEAVRPIAGQDCAKDVVEAGELLKDQIRSDETLQPVR